MELIDFSALGENFSLEDQIREDEDASYTRRLIASLDALIETVAQANADDFMDVEFKPEHMRIALSVVRDALPAIWERMHPAGQWE
jgi:hypothetical protein